MSQFQQVSTSRTGRVTCSQPLIHPTHGGTGAPRPAARHVTGQATGHLRPLCGANCHHGKAGVDRDVACDEVRAGRRGLRSGLSETALGRSGATVARDGRPGLFMSVLNKTMGQGMDSTS